MAHHSGAGVPRPANIQTATGTITVGLDALGLTEEGLPITRVEFVWEELDMNGRVVLRLVSDGGMVTPSVETAAFAERMGMPTPPDGTV